MTLRVLIVPDKFKGTLTAPAAASAIAAGWRKARPGDQLTLLPMSDGGDGFGEIFGRLLQADRRVVGSVDAAHRRRRVPWWFARKSRTAVVESARVIGLAMLPPGRYHPFDLDTFGLGSVLGAAAKTGAAQCLLGIGGSATNDGGFGLARSLGWQFLDSQDQAIRRWTDLRSLARLVRPVSNPLGTMIVTVATDVQNPLLGAHGASRVYGPQKGLRVGDLAMAECCLRRLAAVVRNELGRDFASMPGAGAAGGLGFGLFAFTRAGVESGFDLFARYSRLEQRLAGTDLVVTGEGCIDRSTLMGKGVGDVARMCRRLRIPCLGLAGILRNLKEVKRLFVVASSLAPGLTTPDRAQSRPAYWLAELSRRAGADWTSRVR